MKRFFKYQTGTYQMFHGNDCRIGQYFMKQLEIFPDILTIFV